MKKLYGLGFLSLALLTSSGAVAQDTTTGLQLYYTFNDVSGTNVPDHSASGTNVGTVIGAPETVAGYEGNALQFPLKSDYVQVANDITTSLTDFTVAAWVYLNSSVWYPRIFDFGTSTTSGDPKNYVFLTQTGTSLRYEILTPGTSAQQVNSTSTLPLNAWVHVAFTLKGSVGTIYINGVASGTNTSMTLNPSSLGSTDQNYIARSQWPGDPAFQGIIDEFRLYNRALTADDLLSLTGLGELKNEKDALTLPKTPITGNLTLPTTLGSKGVTVKWASSNNSMIDTLGTLVSRPAKYDTPVMLTATLSQTIGDKTYVLSKEFIENVAALNPVLTTNEVANWDFASDITLDGDTVRVTDSSESGFVGKVMNVARIRTIGNNTKFNVLDLGNDKGYFDMGAGIGEAIYSLNDFTIGAYYRIDDTYTDLNSWGNLLFNFANSADVYGTKKGTMYAGLKNQNYAIAPKSWDDGGEQGFGVGKNAAKGNWHHFAYTQKGSDGTVYVDGVATSTGTVSWHPFNTLRKDGFTGTLYNFIGHPAYVSGGDVYLRNTLVYGLQIYNYALLKDDMTSLLGVTDNIAALNAAYTENPDNVSSNLSTEMTHLTTSLGDLSNVTSNLTLPAKGVLDPSITIQWKSSQEEIISLAGVVTIPDYHAYNVALTATMKTNTGQSLSKTFNVTVPGKAGTAYNNDLLLKYDFATVTNDTVVTDAAEKHFQGIVKNGAKIRTIGTTETGKFNVLALGDSIGYFDMGTEIGKVVYGLNDFTIGAYYRIDPAYTRAELSSNGNFLWCFSNALNVKTPDYSGYLLASLRNQAETISPSNWSGEQTIKLDSAAFKGNWHHFAYTQSGVIGTLYVDGQPIHSDSIKQIPSKTLIDDQRLGTLYNWIGRSNYAGDVYLRKTLVTDLVLYKTALTDAQIQTSVLNVVNKINSLENAFSANEGTAVKQINQSRYKVIAKDGKISILGLTGNEKVSVFDVTGHQLRMSTHSTITLNSGVYIVKIDDSASKVVL